MDTRQFILGLRSSPVDLQTASDDDPFGSLNVLLQITGSAYHWFCCIHRSLIYLRDSGSIRFAERSYSIKILQAVLIAVV
jgi:hypothetical protein